MQKIDPRVNVDSARDKCRISSYRVTQMVSQITTLCNRWIIYV